MPNATTDNSLTKICNPNDQSVNPQVLEMWEIAISTVPRIDAPGPNDAVDRRQVGCDSLLVYDEAIMINNNK